MLIYGLILLIGTQLGFNNKHEQMDALGKLIKVEKSKHEAVAEYESGEARLEIFKSGIVRLTIERGNDERKSFAVVEAPENLSRYKMNVSDDEMSVSLPDGTVKFSPGTMKLSYASQGGAESVGMNNFQLSDSGLAATFDIHGARNFYGLGEKTLPYNKYGSRCAMWNSDYPAYSVRHDPLYESIPFLLKADPNGAYGLFFDNTSRSTFDVGASDSDRIVYTAAGGPLQLYIITGKNAAEVVRRFSELTGKMHMPPIWALGYQQSRWSYYPESRVLDLARSFRSNRIPCDVIYLDIDYMDGYRCFTWSPENFPTPRNMLDMLHDLGFKVVTIIDPGIKNEKGYHVYDSGVKRDVFVKEPDGKCFVGRVWPGDCVFPDFFNQKTREWWGNQYEFLLDYGVDGFWNDMNEPSVFNTPNKTFPLDVVHALDDIHEATHGRVPESLPTYNDPVCRHAEVHNAYGMQMVRATREGLERLEPDKRPFVLTRADYAGGQRYAAMWTGDNFASFAHMKLALTMFLNIGVSGQPFVGSDVGGFMGNPSPELFSRWLELGVFTPFFRVHSVKDSKPREPWAFGPEHTRINREIIERRYELLPEIYTAFRDANQDGLPILRPLYLNYPEDKEAYSLSDEFLFGRKILVAPVLDSGAINRNAYLPEGGWSNFYDGSKIGSGWQKVDAPLGVTPVLIKDGTIVFLQSVVQSTSEHADTLILRVYGEGSANGSAYFDDGESMAYRHGDYLELSVSFKKDASGGLFSFYDRGGFKPRYKHIAVETFGDGPLTIHSGVLRTKSHQAINGTVTRTGIRTMRVTFPFETGIESIRLK